MPLTGQNKQAIFLEKQLFAYKTQASVQAGSARYKGGLHQTHDRRPELVKRRHVAVPLLALRHGLPAQRCPHRHAL